jgi:MurNAc alpha-1-phosphate uridylyltransferase
MRLVWWPIFEAIWRALLPKARTVPFFVCNADIIWLDGARPALIRLAEAWDAARMDALLLLEPVGRAFGYEGPGDFFRADDGRLQRRGDAPNAPFVFTGVQILHPRLFADAPNGAFSLNILYDRAQATRRLFGLVHDGDWLHIGTPETLTAAESWFAAREALGVRTSR